LLAALSEEDTKSPESRGGRNVSPGINVTDLATGKTFPFLYYKDVKGMYGTPAPLAFSPDEKKLAAHVRRYHDCSVRVWDIATGTQVFCTAGETSVLAWSPDGKRLAGFRRRLEGLGVPQVVIWEVEGGRELVVHSGSRDYGGRIAFSPDGRRIAAVVRSKPAAAAIAPPPPGGPGIRALEDPPNVLKVWDVQSGQEILALSDLETHSTYALAFSPDSKRLVTAGRINSPPWRGELTVRDATTGQKILNLTHLTLLSDSTDLDTDLIFSPDGNRLVVKHRSTLTIFEAKPFAEGSDPLPVVLFAMPPLLALVAISVAVWRVRAVRRGRRHQGARLPQANPTTVYSPKPG
jgi:WD40 repeat protein